MSDSENGHTQFTDGGYGILADDAPIYSEPFVPATGAEVRELIERVNAQNDKLDAALVLLTEIKAKADPIIEQMSQGMLGRILGLGK